jgi:F-type H+-transporting ATPase subunit b
MLPKIQSTVDARDAKIAADLEVARGAREAADSLEEGYRAEMDKSRAEAARLSAAAKADAVKSTEQSVAKADAAIATKVDAAVASIGQAKAKAMSEIEGVATDAVQGLVSRVAGLDVDADTARAAVAKELAHG